MPISFHEFSEKYLSENQINNDELRIIFDENPNLIHEKDQNDHTLLYHAIQRKKFSLVEALLRNGAMPSELGVSASEVNDYRSDRKNNPVQFEGLDGTVRDITDGELFLKSTPSYLIYKVQQILPIIESMIERDALEAFQRLLGSRAFSEVPANGIYGKNNETLLHVVCRLGKPEFVEALISHSFPQNKTIPISQKNAEGKYCYELMESNDLTNNIISKLKSEAFTVRLSEAAHESVEKFQETWNEIGTVNINELKKIDGTPLIHILCEELARNKPGQLIEIFSYLQSEKNDVDFNVLNRSGKNILFSSMIYNSSNTGLLKELVEEFGCDLNHVSPERRTPLCSMINAGKIALPSISYTIEQYQVNNIVFRDQEKNKGMPVNLLHLPDVGGMLPAHLAINTKLGPDLFVKLISHAGLFPFEEHLEWIDYESQDRDRAYVSNLLHFACEKGTPEILEALLEQYVVENMTLFREQFPNESEEQIEHRCQVQLAEYLNQYDREIGYTALHPAIINNAHGKAIISILLENGADINLASLSKGNKTRANTPFGRSLAVPAPSDIIKMLVNKQNYNQTNTSDTLQQTPLMILLDVMTSKSDVNTSKSAEKKNKNIMNLQPPADKILEIENKILPYLMDLIGSDEAPLKSKDALLRTPLHYLMNILDRRVMSPIVIDNINILFENFRKAGVLLIGKEVMDSNGKTPMDMLAQVATNHYFHDIVPSKYFSEHGIDATFHEYHIESIFEPIRIVSEERGTTIFSEILSKEGWAIHKVLGELLLSDPDSAPNLLQTLMLNNKESLKCLEVLLSSDTLRQRYLPVIQEAINDSDLLLSVLSDPTYYPLYKALHDNNIINYGSQRFLNIITDELSDNSPYLNLANEVGISQWINNPGFQVNFQGSVTGDTVLHKVFRNGDVDSIPRLLDAGADPTIRNANGRTPRQSAIHHASVSEQPNNYKMGIVNGMRYLANYVRKSITKLRKNEKIPGERSSIRNEQDIAVLREMRNNLRDKISKMTMNSPQSQGDVLDAVILLRATIRGMDETFHANSRPSARLNNFINLLNNELNQIHEKLNSQVAREHSYIVQSQTPTSRPEPVVHAVEPHRRNVGFQDNPVNSRREFSKGDESGLSRESVAKAKENLSMDSEDLKPARKIKEEGSSPGKPR